MSGGLDCAMTAANDVDATVQQIRDQGFAILPAVLSAAEIDAVKEALVPYEQGRPMGRNGFEGALTQRVYSLAAKGPAFVALAEHPRVMDVVERLLMPGFLLSTLQSIRLHPGEPGQPWHADDLFYPVERPRPILAVSAIWAIEAFTEENGATVLAPGSHRWGAEHPDDMAFEPVPAVMPAGSVILFDGALWHRGGQNRSSGTRLAVSPQYCQPWLRPQESQLLICPPERAAALSPRMQSMLGYSIHPPFIGQVDGMHPRRLLDPSHTSVGRTQPGYAAEQADRFLARPEAPPPERGPRQG